jgi:hypothetical protein
MPVFKVLIFKIDRMKGEEMKRLWLVLPSLALVLAFCVSAFAVDVQFSGSFYAAGMYQDRTSFLKGGYHLDPSTGLPAFGDGPSTAFYYQRLRLKTEFTISPGLKLVTRFDAMERSWGAARSAPGTIPAIDSAGTFAENENIAFDWAYVEYTSPIGMFMVGIQDDGGWGTVFSDTSKPQGIITWAAQMSGWTAALQIVKLTEQSKTAKYPSVASDNDTEKYQAAVMYEWKRGQAGLLGIFYHSRGNRALVSPGPVPPAGTDMGSIGKIFVLEPYAIINIGPVKIQAELDYAWGNIKYDYLIGQDLRVDNLIGWIDAGVDFKQFYFGGTFAYVAGNDFSKTDVIKGGFLTGGVDWNPTLILFNNERQYWAGTMNGNNLTSSNMNFIAQAFGIDDTGMYNAWFFQGRAGVRPIDKLDIMASVSYAKADSKTLPGGSPDAVSDVYGTEIDVTATYKITDNLSYMVGAAYLFTGDYFKGFDPTAEVRNNYLVINKLTLTF